MSQVEIAERAGTSRQALNSYEMGQAFPTRKRAKRIDDALSAIVEERVMAAVNELPAPSESMAEEPEEPDPGPDLEGEASAGQPDPTTAES